MSRSLLRFDDGPYVVLTCPALRFTSMTGMGVVLKNALHRQPYSTPNFPPENRAPGTQPCPGATSQDWCFSHILSVIALLCWVALRLDGALGGLKTAKIVQ